jgi:hypothetical protein
MTYGQHKVGEKHWWDVMKTLASLSVIGAADATSLIYIFDDDRLRTTPSAAGHQTCVQRGSSTMASVILKPSAAASDKTAQPLKEHCGR